MANEARLTILVADDDQILLGLMQLVLSADDRYRVLLAQDGEEALDIARREMPDLVLADVSMPKVDGFEVCRILKSAPATEGIKVVLFSGFIQASFQRRVSEVGAEDIFSKPFDMSELRRKLQDVWLNQDAPGGPRSTDQPAPAPR